MVSSKEVIGAHYGLAGWLAQRVTAVLMAIYSLLFLVQLISAPQLDFVGWRGIFTPQWMKLATLLCLTGLYLHAWVGVRNIYMDYVKCGALRLTLYVLTIIWLLACAFWSVRILWGF